MKRRLVIAFCAVLFLVACLAVSAVLFGRDLAQALIAAELASRGLAPVHFAVAEVTLRRIHVTDITVGSDAAFRADGVEAHFQLADLLSGQVAQVVLERPVLRLDVTGEGPVLGGLQPLIERITAGAGDRGDASASPVSAVIISDARVEAQTPLGSALTHLDGQARLSGLGAWSSNLDWTVEGTIGRAGGRLAVELSPDRCVSGRVEIESGQLRHHDLAASINGIAGTLAFSLDETGLELVTADVDLQSIDMPERGSASGRLSLSADPAKLAVEGDVTTDGDALTITVDARIEDYRSRPRVSLAIKGAAEAQAPLWGFLPIPAPDAGRAAVGLETTAILPSPWPAAFDPEGLQDWLSQGSLAGTLELDLQEFSVPERIETLSGQLALAAETADQPAKVTARAGGRLRAAGLSRSWLETFDLPSDILALLASDVLLEIPDAEAAPMTVTIDPTEDGPIVTLSLGALRLTPGGAELSASGQARLALAPDWRLAEIQASDLSVSARDLPFARTLVREARLAGDLSGSPADLSGRAQVDLRLGPIELGPTVAEGVTLAAPLSWRFSENALHAALERPGTLRAENVAQDGVFSATRPLKLSVVEGEGIITPGQGLTYSLTLGSPAFGIAAIRKGAPPLILDAAMERVRLEGRSADGSPVEMTATVSRGEIRLPDLGLSLVLPSATLSLRQSTKDAPEQIDLRIDGVALSRDGAPPLLAPLVISGTLERRANQLRLAGSSGPSGAKSFLTLRGRHDLDRGIGDLSIRARPLDFATGRVQPGDLLPALSELRFVAGRGVAEANLSWSDEGLDSGGRFGLDDATLESGELTVTGLRLDVVLDDLLAPSSPAGQTLSFERLDLGIPLETLDATFRILAGPRLLIEQSGFNLLAGSFSVRDTIIDPNALGQEIALRVGGLDLEEMLNFLQIGGLSGQGNLAGTIPLVVEEGKVLVRRAHLEATGPGVLRYASADATLALQSAGESAELMLRALRDFRYDELSLDADMDAEDQLNLLLSILGHNPQVLDGHPFRFNINLTSDLSPILEALRQGYELTDSLFKRTWDLRR